MSEHRKSEPPFSVSMIKMPDGVVTSVLNYDAEPASMDGFDEGTTFEGYFELSGEGYYLDRVIRLLQAADQFGNDVQIYGFLSDLIDSTRKWVIENELAHVKKPDGS